MAAELGDLNCCTPEGEAASKKFASIKSVAPKKNIGNDATIQSHGNHFNKGDTFNEAIKNVKDAAKGADKAADLCLIYNTLVKAKNGRVWAKADISSYLTTLETECDGNVVKPKTCKEKLGSDYEDKVEECNGRKSEGESVEWSDGECGCVVVKKGEVAPIEEVRGCMVNPTGLPDGVTVNYDPLATVNYGCVFKKDVQLENEFCFCVTDTCEEIGNCLKGKQVISAMVSSYTSFYKKYSRVYENVIKSLAKIKNPFDFRISTEKGFYGEKPGDYIEDLAKALTILEFRGYGLSTNADGNIKDADLVMKSLDGDYLGFFSGASMSSPMYKYFNLQLTDPIIRFRVANNLGGSIVNKRHIKAIQRIINKEGRESDKVKNVNIDIDGAITLQENITTVGLGVLLETKVIGLGKLLK